VRTSPALLRHVTAYRSDEVGARISLAVPGRLMRSLVAEDRERRTAAMTEADRELHSWPARTQTPAGWQTTMIKAPARPARNPNYRIGLSAAASKRPHPSDVGEHGAGRGLLLLPQGRTIPWAFRASGGSTRNLTAGRNGLVVVWGDFSANCRLSHAVLPRCRPGVERTTSVSRKEGSRRLA
jgi:hypothetical protein